ncbi:TetR/AcrR family transcriptional regulator [Vibrio sp. YMD68]|uniref:TetR/AcrR family transcriptional regulator n=1 Tax=Vibrio sp. YMD68 TaxID=3042300 RepID=UPI00249B25DA|nr:TetR/AcrR family transcriptional regulator [Vibrio sp. YMD68]WGV99117.1 TetR/AcrR family transcriptional regulator [Vibrio sp. YMD68]
MKSGRTRSFDKETALENAMLVFWKNGYPGTSLTDLTGAMGINKPSLYSAFGNKENLFNQSLELYLEKYALVHSTHLVEANICLQDRLKNFLTSTARMLTDSNLPKGCLICHSTSELAGTCLPEKSGTKLQGINQQTSDAFTAFFENEIKAGNLAADCDTNAMANYLLALMFGLAISARNGSDFQSLQGIICFSLGNFS